MIKTRVGYLATLLTNMTLLLSGILTSVLVSRALGPVGRGEYVTWHTWAATLALVALAGLPQAVVLDQATAGRHRLGDLARAMSRSLAAALVIILLLSSAAGPGWTVTAAAILVAATTQMYAVGASEEQRLGRMTMEFNAIRLLPQAAAILTMCLLLAVGPTSARVWLFAVAAFQCLSLLAWFVPIARREGLRPSATGSGIPGHLRLAPGNWATQVQQALDLLAITVICPPKYVALYAIGVAAQGAVFAAGQSVGMHWLSRLRNQETDRRSKLRSELYRTGLITAAVAVPLAASSGLWVRAVYGEAFAGAVPLVIVLCGVGVLRSFDYLLAQECLITGQGDRVALLRLPSIAAMLACFGAAAVGFWHESLIALIPGVGYLVSSAVFAWSTVVPVPAPQGAADADLAARVA